MTDDRQPVLPPAAGPAPDAEQPSRRRFLQAAAGTLVATGGAALAGCEEDRRAVAAPPPPPAPPVLAPLPAATFAEARLILSEPMLQNPGPDSVRVVWFTEAQGANHRVRLSGSNARDIPATSREMTRFLEDRDSQVFQRITSELPAPERRRVWRHEAVVTGLRPGERVAYAAVSEVGGLSYRSSRLTTLQPLPAAGQRVRLLLTSDQQNNRMSTAHYQKVQETIGDVDAVLFPGDFVSQPNRASEWFDRVALANPSYFQSLQGSMQRWNPGSPFRGGDILQNAPLYGCLGNHEYPGRWRMDADTNNPNNTLPITINNMDNDPQPRWFAEHRYEQLRASINPSNNAAFRERWITDNSFDWTTYREMWSLPQGPEGSVYYSQRFGDVFLISLDANRIWRTWNANQRGKFTESFNDQQRRITATSDDWGFGDFTFRDFGRGSRQYAWLQDVLRSSDCRSARYRIVLSHQTMAGLGDNAVPVQAMQRITIELTDGSLIGPFPAAEWPQRWPTVEQALTAGRVRYARYEYPLQQDMWLTDIEPLLLEANVQLVHTGHSHMWNRCTAGGGRLHYLETSNNGNSFGAMFFPTPQPGASPGWGPRGTQPGNDAWRSATVLANPQRTALEWNAAHYPSFGEPHGRPMIMPTIFNPMRELQGAPVDLPFIASNVLTAFTIVDTQGGLVSSYVYDTRSTANPTRKFDEFALG